MLTDLGHADTPVEQLPPDLMDRVEKRLKERTGGSLSWNRREDLNRVRSLLRDVSGTGCIDLERRTNGVEVAGQWTMSDEATIVPVQKLGFTDVDIEQLVKCCSHEIRQAIGERNQLCEYLAGGTDAAGPCSPDILAAAAELLKAAEGRPAYWTAYCTRRSEEFERLFRIGWAAVEKMESGQTPAAEIKDTKDRRRMIQVRREHLDASGRLEDFARRRPKNVSSFVREGWRQTMRVAFPTAPDMCAAATLMGLATRFNPGVLARMHVDELRPREMRSIELDDDGIAEGDRMRLHAAPYKPRAGRLQPVDFPVSGRAEAPGPLAEFVRDWTAHVRAGADRHSERLFIFASLSLNSGLHITSFVPSDASALVGEFASLCRRAGVIPLTPRALRSMGVDMIHDRSNGDQMLVHASGNWAPGSTMPRLYMEGPALGRDRERLYWSGRLLDRQSEHGIDVFGRPDGADLFSATEGFRCRDPLDSPDELPAGDLCRSRGLCPVCPHADIDTAVPAWSVARIFALARHIAERLEEGASTAWERRYRPVLAELLDVWIPIIPDEILSAARRHSDYPYERLTDVQAD
ncbi:hypothetical protein NF701_09020 [Sphingomonadaceae bacterium OTU29THOMA1]|nr:hypothetical protein NF701_09020 [Sphingomonadaceae bacterium OTU29THOMA1]